jgi:hypothetical protein
MQSFLLLSRPTVAMRRHGGLRLDTMALVEDKRRPCMLWPVCDVLMQTYALCWAHCPCWCPLLLMPQGVLPQYWWRCCRGASTLTLLCLLTSGQTPFRVYMHESKGTRLSSFTITLLHISESFCFYYLCLGQKEVPNSSFLPRSG